MIGDINKFVEFKSHDGSIVSVGSNESCHVKGIQSITLDGKTNTKDVYFVDGLKHNLLSVGQLADKGYQLQFIEKTCMIRDKDRKVIGIGTKYKGNLFQFNPTKMTCLVAKVDESWLWHKRIYHIKFDNIAKTSNMFAFRDFPKIVKPTNTICKECVLKKHNRVSFPKKKFTTTTKLEIVHTDLSGPTKTKGFYGERYFMILVDDFSRMMWVAFLKEKSEAFDKFKIFKNRVDNESGMKIKFLRSMIRGLQYLTHTRPDIENAVGIVAKFQADSKEAHYAAIKRIFRYLKGTLEFGLWYDRSNDFTLYPYTNVDWAGSMDERKSTSGGAFFLGGRLVSWLRKKKDCTSQSTIEEEYVAAANDCNQVVWMKQKLKDRRIEFSEPIVIHCDNTSTMNMSKNLVLHSKTTHFYQISHVEREICREGN